MTANEGVAAATASAAGRGRAFRARAWSALRDGGGGTLLCASAVVHAAGMCRRGRALTESSPDALTRRVAFGIY